MHNYLDFEKPIAELEGKIEELRHLSSDGEMNIADEVGISRRQLERLFRQHTGVSPVEYYTELRVGRAHALLNETNLSIAEIAAATGFSGTSQLAARFRKRFGKSPGAYRRSWSGGG